MKIWVDADACPGVIKEVLFKAARRTGVELTLVANQPLRVPPAPNIHTIRVAAGFDVADHEIVRVASAGDLVITNDIPLAAELIGNGVMALSPRGEMFDKGTIGAKLNLRDFADTLRASGINSGGPPPLGQAERKSFAGHLDRILAQRGA